MANNIRVSEPTYEAIEQAARESGVDVNDLAEEAIRRMLLHRRVDLLARYGREQSIALGKQPSDAVEDVRSVRGR